MVNLLPDFMTKRSRLQFWHYKYINRYPVWSLYSTTYALH